ncbi:hypothetical protein [Laribacter hongkongensis]|uniref:hypothetical protein n=1 Tax=Laribacter hongkongensis TaxID=168471 RepID=UPI001EFCD9D6|nr:hypothetical protein [Laribacter hongkongensis]MCG9081479.1 hypothetical protein [Laribacter hongkongensis]
MKFLALLLLAILVGYAAGYVDAHATIARECRLLGGFYVGETVYACVTRTVPDGFRFQ